jgi:hypothetical protein
VPVHEIVYFVGAEVSKKPTEEGKHKEIYEYIKKD